MSRVPAKPTPMCCVSISYFDLLLPADKGMKLVEILTHAIEVKKDYDEGGYVYVPQQAPEVQYSAVKTHRIRAPRTSAPEATADGVVLRALPSPVKRLTR